MYLAGSSLQPHYMLSIVKMNQPIHNMLLIYTTYFRSQSDHEQRFYIFVHRGNDWQYSRWLPMVFRRASTSASPDIHNWERHNPLVSSLPQNPPFFVHTSYSFVDEYEWSVRLYDALCIFYVGCSGMCR